MDFNDWENVMSLFISIAAKDEWKRMRQSQNKDAIILDFPNISSLWSFTHDTRYTRLWQETHNTKWIDWILQYWIFDSIRLTDPEIERETEREGKMKGAKIRVIFTEKKMWNVEIKIHVKYAKNEWNCVIIYIGALEIEPE